MKVNLADIRIDGGTQGRVSINTDTVGEYAEAMTGGQVLPPVLVFFDGVAYWLADGFHRLHAQRKIGAVSIEAEVVNGTLLDAKLHAYAANQSHGLRRSNEDKRKAVLGMLADFGAWSDNKIAKHVGVSHPFVGSLRSSLVTVTSEKPAERTYTTKHGNEAVMKTAGIGRAAPAPVPMPARQQQQEAEHEAEDAGPSAEEDAYLAERAQQSASELHVLLDANEPLKLATEKWQQAQSMVDTLQLRIHGLRNENAELVRTVKYWRRQAEKAAA
jgi:hypothetical protein